MVRNKHRANRKKEYLFLGALFFGIFYFCSSARAEIQEVFDSKETQDVYLYKGDLVSIKVYSLTRLAVSTPGIIEIANADVDELLIIGQSVGQTALFVWDEFGKKKIMVRVFEEDLDLVISRLEKLFNAAKVKGVSFEKDHLERKVIMKGTIAKEDKEKVEKIIASDLKGYLINMLVYEGDLIQIDVQVSELSTTLQKALGIDWNTGTSGSFALRYPETLPTFDGSIGDLFKIGSFSRTTAIIATVNALVAEGKARVLSKPTILTVSGETASFQVGGEIPVRTTTSSSGGTSVQENVTYTNYGVEVQVTPEVKEGKIDIKFNVTIRDIDASNAVGENVAFTTRTATTRLLLNDGQTIVLAGLIKQNKAETSTGVPFLRRIPLIGMIFRNRNWPTNFDQEVVISLSPRIIRQKDMSMVNQHLKDRYKMIEKEEGQADGEEGVGKEEKPATEQAALKSVEEFRADPSQKIGEEKKELVPAKIPTENTEKPGAKEGTPSAGERSSKAEIPDGTIPERKDIVSAGARPSVPVEVPQDVKDEKTGQKIADYVKGVQQRISQAASFPLQAKEKGWQGTVTLSLVLLSDGSLKDVGVKNSSGHEVFDKDAVNTAKILAPFDSFPADIQLEELVVNIPIVYSQDNILEGSAQN